MHINTLKVCYHITGSYIPTNYGFATEKPIVCYRQTHSLEILYINSGFLDKYPSSHIAVDKKIGNPLFIEVSELSCEVPGEPFYITRVLFAL